MWHRIFRAFNYQRKEAPISGPENALLNAWQRTQIATVSAWAQGRIVQRSLAPLEGGLFSTEPNPPQLAWDASSLGVNELIGIAGLNKGQAQTISNL